MDRAALSSAPAAVRHADPSHSVLSLMKRLDRRHASRFRAVVRVSLLDHEGLLTLRLNNPTVSLKTACLAILATAAAGLTLLLFRGSPASENSAESYAALEHEAHAMPAPLALPEAGYLKAGDPAPEIGDGVRFDPPLTDFDGYSGKVTVLDLWHTWCPFARNLSPGLIQMIDDYSDSPVQFLSLTSEEAISTGMPDRGWPSGFGATETLKPFRCLFNDMTYGLAVHPAIYLIDAEGRVLWCDGGMREQHADASEVERSVCEALDAALSQLPDAPQVQPAPQL